MDIYSQTEANEDPELFNSKKRKILGDGVFESFMHPKQIKIGKIALKSETKSESKEQMLTPTKALPVKQTKHKFNVI